MITQEKDLPAVGQIITTLQFQTGPGPDQTIANKINTTGATLTITSPSTGKYHITANKPIFNAQYTVIGPNISDSASIPLSKTTWADYNYHYIRLTEYIIELVCQLSATGAYAPFTDVFDGITIPLEVNIYNYKF